MTHVHLLTTQMVMDAQMANAHGDITAVECIRCGGSAVYCDCVLDGPEWVRVIEARQWVADGTLESKNFVRCRECDTPVASKNLSEWGFCIGCVIKMEWDKVRGIPHCENCQIKLDPEIDDDPHFCWICAPRDWEKFGEVQA
jgi:hypothetical protein